MSRKKTSTMVAIPTPENVNKHGTLFTFGLGLVCVHKVGYQKCNGKSNQKCITLQKWAQLRDQCHSARSKILTNCNLLEEDWNPTEGHGDEINDEKCT